MIKEIQRKYASGYLALVVIPVLLIADLWFLVRAVQTESAAFIICAILIGIVLLVCCAGFFMVHPNQARVLTLFGTYVGSALDTGLRWANPFYAKKAVSLRVRNFVCRKTAPLTVGPAAIYCQPRPLVQASKMCPQNHARIKNFFYRSHNQTNSIN